MHMYVIFINIKSIFNENVNHVCMIQMIDFSKICRRKVSENFRLYFYDIDKVFLNF